MSSPEEHNKRKIAEQNKSSSVVRPHKKRLISRSSSPSLASEGGDQEETGDSELLENLRKEAIKIQWKEYLRLQKRWEARMEHAKGRSSLCNALLQIWETQFKQWQADLQQLKDQQIPEYTKTHSDSDDSLSKHILESDWATSIAINLSTALERRGRFRPHISHMSDTIDAWISSREALAKSFEPLLDTMVEKKQRYKGILGEWVNRQRSLCEKNALVREANAKFLLLSEEHRLLMARTNLISKLEETTRLELDRAQRQNAKNEVAPSERNEQPTDNDLTKGEKEEECMDENIKETKETDQQEASLAEAKRTLDQQLREIEAIKERRIELKQAIARKEVDFVNVPESVINKRYPKLYDERDYQRERESRTQRHVDELREALKKVLTDRHDLIHKMGPTQILSASKDLWDELRKLDADVMQIRGERDALETEKHRVTSSEECYKIKSISMQVSSALLTCAGNHEKKIAILESEVCRRQRKRIAKSGIRELYKCMMNTADSASSLEQQLQTEISDIEKKLNEAKASIFAGNEMDSEAQQWVDTELHWASEFKRLEKETDDFVKKYGFDPASAKEGNVLQTLQDRFKSEESTIAQRRTQMESLEANETQLLSEIESILSAYDEGEKSKVIALEEQTAKAVAAEQEQAKYKELFMALIKISAVHETVAKEMDKQIKKQTEYSKQLREQEKHLEGHSKSLDRALRACTSACAIYDEKSVDAERTLKDLEEKITAARGQAKELEESIVANIRQIEEKAHVRLRLEENSELLRRKVEAMAKVEKASDMKQEKEGYRELLNCSSCRTQLKSHVLIRCGHMFCKRCLDTLIEKRQRRCPTCSEPFAVDDVRQFFFN